MHIYLIGFMCSGKTTLGHALAKRLSMPFYDLDDYVESKAGMSISRIFETHGEDAFRDLESRALAELSQGAPAIIACGGGTPCRDSAWSVMRAPCSLSVWLHPDNAERLLNRLLDGREKRPLIAGISGADEMARFAEDTMLKRKPYYNKADAKFDSSYLETTDEIEASVDKFIELLRQYGK